MFWCFLSIIYYIFFQVLEFFNRVHSFYENNLFCDLRFVAGNVDHNFNSVNCHSCILVSAIPQLFDIMKNAFEVFDEDAVARIYFPGFSYTDLKLFIVSLYKKQLESCITLLTLLFRIIFTMPFATTPMKFWLIPSWHLALVWSLKILQISFSCHASINSVKLSQRMIVYCNQKNMTIHVMIQRRM